ncbi:MAG: hypothetical protein ACWA5W_05525 [Phycisphaerales bacterium]
MLKLKIILGVIACSQLILGLLTLIAPTWFYEAMSITAPHQDNLHMIGLLSTRFLVFGVAFIVAIQNPVRHRNLMIMMAWIQLGDLLVGITYTLLGVVTIRSTGLAMFDAALFAGLLFAWMPKKQQINEDEQP